MYTYSILLHKFSNAQVTQWRGCYDDICEYRRIEATSNSPEFTKKKTGKCGHVIKHLHTSTTPLRCSTMPFDCPETKQEYTKNILRTGEDIWRIYYSYPQVSYK